MYFFQRQILLEADDQIGSPDNIDKIKIFYHNGLTEQRKEEN